MGHRFADLMFTESVKAAQEEAGSRKSYARMEGAGDNHHRLGPKEAAFIAARDSFYQASRGETGWPYVQHRGGPQGFVRVLDETTLGYADFRGNRQYISVGNLSTDDRVALIFMDYPNRLRLKLIGRARFIDERTDDGADADVLKALALPDYRARVERGVLITVEGFDWNCPQHITPRHTDAAVADMTGPLEARILELEAELVSLRSGGAA